MAVEAEPPHRDEEEGAGEPTTITILPAMPATNAVNPVTLLIIVQMEDSQNEIPVSFRVIDQSMYQPLTDRKRWCRSAWLRYAVSCDVLLG
jgi:hypothetical protein